MNDQSSWASVIADLERAKVLLDEVTRLNADTERRNRRTLVMLGVAGALTSLACVIAVWLW